jgi:hypothetical protein
MENINSWKDIPWSNTEERVFRLQLRIYRAAADQKFEKMYKLQKLLIYSSAAKFLCVRKIETAKNKFALAKRLQLEMTSLDIRGEDPAKQMLAYLALCPQWKAWFSKKTLQEYPFADQYIHSLIGNRSYKRQAFSYIPYADDLFLMHHLDVKEHKQKLRKIIQSYRGATQERLIQKLNPVICGWSVSNRTKVSRKSFQALDKYVFIHLWKWVLKRHPKISKTKLKNLYWHKIGSRNWVFGVKTNEEVKLELQMHFRSVVKANYIC